MKILIIEDEKPAVQKMVRLLNEIDPEIQIAAVIGSVEEAINWWISQPHPDLILMDIQLDDGVCFEIFENTEIRTPVIFITAFDEYLLKAFRVNSIDYILKPLNIENMTLALNKYKTLYDLPDNKVRIDPIVNQMQSRRKERFLIRIGDHFRSVQTGDIDCFYIRERFNFMITRDGRELPVDYSLDKIEKMVDPGKFFRINRNMIVSVSAIKDIMAISSSRLKLKIEGWKYPEPVMVSRDRVSGFKEWMDR